MNRSGRAVTLAMLCLLSLVLLNSCTKQAPEDQIELKLEDYRAKILELTGTMKQLRDGEITATEAQEKLGDDFVRQLSELEQEVRALVDQYRGRIGDDKAVAFLNQLEEYRRLGHPDSASRDQ